MSQMESPVVDAIVLAGAPNTGKLSEVSSEAWEALIELDGEALVCRSVRPLLAARTVGRIVVVGPKPELDEALAGFDVAVIPPTGDMFDNVLEGFRYLSRTSGQEPGLALVSSADVPLITPEIVDGLVKTCLERGGDAFYPLMSRETMEAAFPGTKRTYGKLRDGTFTGGNLFVVNGTVLEGVRDKARALIDARKNALKMAATIGFGFVLKLALGLLTVKELENYVGRTFGFEARAMFVPWAEIGIDVDKPGDIDLVRSYLASRSS